MPMYLGKEWRTVLEVDNISGTKDRDYCYPEKTGAWRTIQNGIEKPANVQENATVSLSLIPGSPRVSYPIVPHSAEKSARVAHGTRVLIQQYTLTCGSVHFKAQYFKRMVWDRVGSQREESFVTGNFSGSCDKDEESKESNPIRRMRSNNLNKILNYFVGSPFSSLSEAAKNKEALPDTTSLGALVQPTNSSISQESTPETDGVHDTNESSPILGKYGIGDSRSQLLINLARFIINHD